MHRPDETVRGARSGQQRDPARGEGGAAGPDRTQRRREDDALQPDQRDLSRYGGAGEGVRPGHHPPAALPADGDGPRPDLPDHLPLFVDDRGGKPGHRRDGARADQVRDALPSDPATAVLPGGKGCPGTAGDRGQGERNGQEPLLWGNAPGGDRHGAGHLPFRLAPGRTGGGPFPGRVRPDGPAHQGPRPDDYGPR